MINDNECKCIGPHSYICLGPLNQIHIKTIAVLLFRLCLHVKLEKQATLYLCLTKLKRCSSLLCAEQKLSRSTERERARERCEHAEQKLSRRTEREREKARERCEHAEQKLSRRTQRERERERERKRERGVSTLNRN